MHVDPTLPPYSPRSFLVSHHPAITQHLSLVLFDFLSDPICLDMATQRSEDERALQVPVNHSSTAIDLMLTPSSKIPLDSMSFIHLKTVSSTRQ
jgi:hypothetical protein